MMNVNIAFHILQGTPKLTSRAYLLVRLLDINDNPPEFEHSTYTNTIREDTEIGSSVMQVFATSRDTGINAEITYNIIAGNEQQKFRIDDTTGKRKLNFLFIVNHLKMSKKGKSILGGQCTFGPT